MISKILLLKYMILLECIIQKLLIHFEKHFLKSIQILKLKHYTMIGRFVERFIPSFLVNWNTFNLETELRVNNPCDVDDKWNENVNTAQVLRHSEIHKISRKSLEFKTTTWCTTVPINGYNVKPVEFVIKEWQHLRKSPLTQTFLWIYSSPYTYFTQECWNRFVQAHDFYNSRVIDDV